jgi:hypothetical protein
LLTLDDLWAAHLEDARSGNPTEAVDPEGLIALAEEMELALRDAPSAAGQVIGLLDKLPPEADADMLEAIAAQDERLAGALSRILTDDLGGLDAGAPSRRLLGEVVPVGSGCGSFT